MKESQNLVQPWRAILPDPDKAPKVEPSLVKDTDEFKKGEVIIIGGQGAITPPPESRLIYDTKDDD